MSQRPSAEIGTYFNLYKRFILENSTGLRNCGKLMKLFEFNAEMCDYSK